MVNRFISRDVKFTEPTLLKTVLDCIDWMIFRMVTFLIISDADRLPMNKSEDVANQLLHYRLHCLCFISFSLFHTSLFMFHLISFSSSFIDHVLLLFLSVRNPSYLFHLPWPISFNLIVSITFQPIPSLEINDLQVS